MKKKNVVVGVSFPEVELLNYAKAEAARQRRSFSNFVTGLIVVDRERRAGLSSAQAAGAALGRREGDAALARTSRESAAPAPTPPAQRPPRRIPPAKDGRPSSATRRESGGDTGGSPS